MKKIKASGSKGGYFVKPTIMTEYEKERMLTIEKNAARFEELGLHKLAKDLMDKNKLSSQKKKEKTRSIIEEDQDYVPIEDDNHDGFSDNELEECYVNDTLGSMLSKKVKSKEKIVIPIGRKKQPSCPAMSMEEYIKMQKGELCTNEGPRRSKRYQIEDSQENQRESVVDPTLSIMVSNQDQGDNHSNESTEASSKKYRGPTQLYDIHQRKLEDRVAIFVNSRGQPIGPEEELSKFSLFLGTIATEHRWAPLTYTSWRRVPNKDKIWEYINEISDKNTESRNLQDNNHTVGPVSFARIHHKLSINDKEPPSKRKMFEETRKRKEGSVYKQSDEGTHAKIEKMKQIEVSQAIGDVEIGVDAFDEVMNEMHPKRLRLFGRGVSNKELKEKESGASIIAPSEVIELMKTNMQKELDTHKEAMQAELQAEKETLSKEREAQVEMSKHLSAQFTLMADMQKEFQKDKENAARDLAKMALQYLRQMTPDTTPDMLAQAVISSIPSTCDK